MSADAFCLGVLYLLFVESCLVKIGKLKLQGARHLSVIAVWTGVDKGFRWCAAGLHGNNLHGRVFIECLHLVEDHSDIT